MNNSYIWDKYIRHFSKTEKWGDWAKINGMLLYLLERIRERTKKPVIIHCAYETSGHSQNSMHYSGNAADFHISGMDLYFAYQMIMQILRDYQMHDHTGLGIYLDWHNQGFHLDLRAKKGRWGRIDGKYVAINTVLERIR